MNRKDLEHAWPASEPSAGFADRVLERAQRGPAPPVLSPRRSRWAWLAARRVRWLALPAAALALGLASALLIGPAPSARDGDVIAAEPRTISIGARVIAELSMGARLRWSGGSAEREVWQDSGEVTYRVAPGADFRVLTPHGSVAVLGTVFRVAIADRNAATEGEEPVKKRWAIAGSGAGATAVALLLVSVEQGRVRLSNGTDELALGPGQSGTIGADGVLRAATEEPSEPANDEAAQQAERARARQVADAVRRHAARRRAALQAAEASGPKHATDAKQAAPLTSAAAPPANAPTADAPAQRSEEEQRRRDYVQRTMREQYYPVARDCYEELLGRDPKARGKVVLEFAIVGDGDAGVVDRVATREDEDAIDDPEFVMCMRESLYTAVFEAPPPGASETTVVYPVMLEPGE